MIEKIPQADVFLKQLNFQNKKEKLLNLIRKNQKLVVSFLLIVVFLIIYFFIFSYYKESQAKKYSTLFQQSMIDEANGEKSKSLEILEKIYQSKAPAGIKQIASLHYAVKLMNEGKVDKSLEVYLAINQNKKFTSYFREYAGLIVLKNLVESNKVEDKEKITLLTSKLEKEAKFLKNQILEQKAIFLWQSDNFKEANTIFQNIANDPEASELIKNRVAEMIEIYQSKFPDEVLPTKELEKDKKEENLSKNTQNEENKKKSGN